MPESFQSNQILALKNKILIPQKSFLKINIEFFSSFNFFVSLLRYKDL